MPKGIYKRTQSEKDRISKLSLGTKQSNETIRKKVESRKGYKHSHETRLKISKANKGQKLSSEQYKKLLDKAKLRRGNKLLDLLLITDEHYVLIVIGQQKLMGINENY